VNAERAYMVVGNPAAPEDAEWIKPSLA